MANDFKIGAGLALDGEKEFKSAISGINKDLSVLGSEMKAVTAKFSDNANSMESLTAKQDVYNKRIDEQKKKVETLSKALESAKKEYGEGSDKVKSWQIQLNNANADLSKTESALNGVNKEIDNFGKDSDSAGNEIEKAGKKAKSSGDDAEKGGGGWSKLGKGLGAVATAAGAAVAGLASAAAGAVVGGVKMAASAAKAGAEYADNVSTIATQTGLTTDQIQQLQYQAELVDVPLETVTGSMAKLTKNMATAQGGTGDAAKAFKALGISVTDANGNLRNNQDVFNDAIDALGQMENETQRDAYAMQIFGKSAQDLNPLILAGSDALNKLSDDALSAGYILSGSALKSLNSFQDSMDKFSKQKDALTNAIGVAAAPAFKMFTDNADLATRALTQLINGDIDADRFTSIISKAIDNVITYITKALPKLIETGTAIIQTIIDALSKNLPKLLSAATPIITTLISGIINMIPALVEAAIPIVQALVDGIVGALPVLIPAAVDLLMTIVQAIIDNLPLLIDAAMTLIVTLAQGIAAAVPELVPAIVDTVLMIVDTLIDNIDLLVDASIAIIIGLADGLIAAVPKLIDKAPEIIFKLVDALIANVPKLVEAGIKLIVSLLSGVVQAIPKLATAIPKIIATVIGGLVAMTTKSFQIGGNLISGLWNGISDKFTWLKNKLSGFAKSVTDAIKSFFGVHSPSTVFAGIGGFLSEGLAEGISSKSGMVSAAMQDINDDLQARANVSVSGGVGGGYGVAVSNVYMDSVLVASATGRAQYRKNATRARSYGVVPA